MHACMSSLTLAYGERASNNHAPFDCIYMFWSKGYWEEENKINNMFYPKFFTSL